MHKPVHETKMTRSQKKQLKQQNRGKQHKDEVQVYRPDVNYIYC